jgi:hypothetical protein
LPCFGKRKPLRLPEARQPRVRSKMPVRRRLIDRVGEAHRASLGCYRTAVGKKTRKPQSGRDGQRGNLQSNRAVMAAWAEHNATHKRETRSVFQMTVAGATGILPVRTSMGARDALNKDAIPMWRPHQ